MPKRTLGLAAVAATLIALPPAASASAATATFNDRFNDVSHGGDVRTVEVANKARNVWVNVTMRDLEPDPDSGVGGAVFLDTDGQPGPEYVVVGGFFDGTDYALLRTDTWKLSKAAERVECSYRMRLDYAADTARFRIGKRCFAEVPGSGTVRVEVRTSAQSGSGVDWLGAPRRFSKAVPQG
jgi:hypothetical protein